MQPLIFFGNERLCTGLESTNTPTLRALIDHGYQIAAVVSSYEPAMSRNGRKLEIAELAEQNSIPVLLPKKLSEIIDQLDGYKAAVGVLAAYGKIIPQRVIDLFPHGIVNIHPSLLPIYRGPTPIEQAILDGAPQTGVSLMQLTAGMDEGPVYIQEELKLNGSESKAQLAQSLGAIGARLLIEQLPSILQGKAKPTPQDNSKATYNQLINKADGQIDWRKPAEQIERQIRAYLGWPGSRTELGGREVIITAAHIAKPDENTIKLLTHETDTGMLIIDRLKPTGKREMTGPEFLAGQR